MHKLHLDQLPILIESTIEKFNLLKPMLEAEYEAAGQTA
jgi:hypothetical protein